MLEYLRHEEGLKQNLGPRRALGLSSAVSEAVLMVRGKSHKGSLKESIFDYYSDKHSLYKTMVFNDKLNVA